jgi:hypothetical protein
MKTSIVRVKQAGILALVAGAGVLLAFWPAASQAQNNTYYGVGALLTATETGVLDDTAFGVNALHATTGQSNTATGVNALLSNTNGSFNTAYGQAALFSNTAGSYNTANGYKALGLNTTGTANVANGYEALLNCITDSQETATGFQALYNDQMGFPGTPNRNVPTGIRRSIATREEKATSRQDIRRSI